MSPEAPAPHPDGRPERTQVGSLTARGVACALGMGGVAVSLPALLLPDLIDLGRAADAWRRVYVFGGAVVAALLVLWALHGLRPLVQRPHDDPKRRRVAHDFPFRLSRLGLLGAVLGGASTTTYLWPAHTGLAVGVVAGILTYLLGTLPALICYLVARRLFRAGAAGAEPTPPRGGLRQSIGLRLAVAVELPTVVCATGIVMVDQASGHRYAREVEDFSRQRYDALLRRALALLPNDEVRREVTRRLPLPEGIALLTRGDGRVEHYAVAAGGLEARDAGVRWPPWALLLGVALLAAYLRRWLTREVTGELDAVAQALAQLESSTQRADFAPPTGAVALRETQALIDALDEAVRGFAAQHAARREAATRRRAAEQAKARFLAHLGHELKSPLNTILGFTELLLAEIDGALEPADRERLFVVWRCGDGLLRFILALLDLARCERPVEGEASPGQMDAAALRVQLLGQHRSDPLGRLRLSVVSRVGPEVSASAPLEPATQTILLAAGLLLDATEAGEVEAAIGATETGRLQVVVSVISADADPVDRAQLNAACESFVAGRPEEASPVDDETAGGPFVATLTLLHRLARGVGAELELAVADWPRLTITWRALGAPEAGA